MSPDADARLVIDEHSISIFDAPNLVVDPDGRLRIIDISGFNRIKILPKPESRQGKAVALQQCEYEVIIQGSSTAEVGMDRASVLFDGSAVCNAGLRASAMHEIYRMAAHAVQNQNPRTVIIELDFAAFNKGRTPAADYAEVAPAEVANTR